MRKFLVLGAVAAMAVTNLQAVIVIPLGAIWHNGAKGKGKEVKITLRDGRDETSTSGKAPGDVKEIVFEKVQLPPDPDATVPEWVNGDRAGAGAFHPPGDKPVSVILDRQDNIVSLAGMEIPDNDRGKTWVKFEEYPRLVPDQVYELTVTRTKKRTSTYWFRVVQLTGKNGRKEFVAQFATPPRILSSN